MVCYVNNVIIFGVITMSDTVIVVVDIVVVELVVVTNLIEVGTDP